MNWSPSRLWAKTNLVSRVSLVVALSVLAVTVGLAYQFTTHVPQEAQSRMTAEYDRQADLLEVVVLSIASPNVAPGSNADVDHLTAALSNYQYAPDVTQISFRDKAGTTVFNKAIDVPLEAPRFFARLGGLETLEFKRPLTVNGTNFGVLTLSVSPNRIINLAWAQTMLLVQVMFISLAIMLCLVWLVLHRALDPLRTLAAAEKKLSGGDLATRVAPAGSPEVSLTLSSFNQMAAAIQATLLALQEMNITERIQAEEQPHYQSNLLGSVQDAVIGTDLNYSIQHWNAAAQSLYGWTADEVLGHPMRAFIRNEYLPGTNLDDVLQAISEKGYWQGEVRQNRRDGTLMPILSSVSLVKDSQGQPTGFVAVNRDISERKQVEELLHESEFRYRQLLEVSPIGVAVHVDRKIVFTNPAGARLLGAASPDELIGKPIAEIVHPDNLPAAANRIQRMLAGEVGLYPVEDRYLRLDGSVVPVEVMAVPLTYEGRPAVQVMVTDITERKRAVEKLRESEERLRLSTELANVAVWEYDFHTNNMARSKNHDQLYGLEWQSTWRFETFLEATHHEDREDSNRIIQESAAPGGPDDYKFDFRVVYPDRSIHWLFVRGQIVERDAHGQGTLARGSLIDITERKRTEAEISHNAEQLAATLDIQHALAAALDQHAIWMNLGQGVQQLFPDVATIFVSSYDPERQMISAKYGCQDGELVDHGALPPIPLSPPGQGQQSHVIHTRQPLVIAAGLEEQLAHNNVVVFVGSGDEGTQSALYVPMLAHDKVLGVIQLQSYAPNRFQVTDIRLLTLVANTAAVSIQNAQLYEVAQNEIDERRQAESALLVANQQLALAQRSAGAGMWDWDMPSGKLNWSTELFELFGLDPARSEATFDVWRNVMYPADRQSAGDRINESIRNHIPLVNEYRVTLPSGAVRWIQALGDTLYDEQGQPQRMSGICLDITERKQVEFNLVESEQRYRALFENMSAGFVLFEVVQDGQGVPIDLLILAANDEFANTTGLKIPDVFGEYLTRVLPGIEHDAADWIGTYGRIALSGEPRQFEQGSELLGYCFAVTAYQAGPKQCAVSFANITERKRAEAALRLQSAALNAAANAILITDREGSIEWVNEAFYNLTGYTAAEAIGKNPRELVKSGRHDRAVFADLWDTILAGRVWRGEIINRRKDGSLYTEEETITPVRDAQGEISHFIAIKQDISPRKALEAENQKLTEQFYQAQKLDSIGQLAGGIAHDFNNFLVPIMGYAELGMLNTAPESKLYRHLEQIKRAGERAASLTRQILAFSRRQVLEMKTTDLNQVVAEIEEMLQRLIGDHIILQTTLAANLPAIKGDQGQLEQVILNLVINARDAMPDGGRLTIETTAVVLDESFAVSHVGTQPGSYVQLAVSDTGHGMDAATQQHIFEPFYTTKDRGHGTGLGLATVFGIVKQHGGNIWVYSEPDRGATFKIFLPVAEPSAPLTASELPPVGDLHGTETILVVEDELAVRQLVSSTLRSYSYQVLEAGDPVKGLEVAGGYQGVIHLLLTDVIMPTMNGRELFHRLVADRPELKVLYMSGYTDSMIDHHGVLDEGMAFLSKPFAINNLLLKVRGVLG